MFVEIRSNGNRALINTDKIEYITESKDGGADIKGENLLLRADEYITTKNKLMWRQFKEEAESKDVEKELKSMISTYLNAANDMKKKAVTPEGAAKYLGMYEAAEIIWREVDRIYKQAKGD